MCMAESTDHGGFLSSLVVPMIDIFHPGLTAVQILDEKFILTIELGKLGFQITNNQRIYIRWGLGRDETITQISISSTRRTIDKTYRMLNFPATLAGITVFAPTPWNAPSMPCKDKEG